MGAFTCTEEARLVNGRRSASGVGYIDKLLYMHACTQHTYIYICMLAYVIRSANGHVEPRPILAIHPFYGLWIRAMNARYLSRSKLIIRIDTRNLMDGCDKRLFNNDLLTSAYIKDKTPENLILLQISMRIYQARKRNILPTSSLLSNYIFNLHFKHFFPFILYCYLEIKLCALCDNLDVLLYEQLLERVV